MSKCDCKVVGDNHDEWCDAHPANRAVDRESELLGHIEDLELQVCRLKSTATQAEAKLACIEAERAAEAISNTRSVYNGTEVMRLYEDMKAKLALATEALRKIDEPKKYHHTEPDDYTQVACFQFVANEARKALGDYPGAVSGVVKLLPDTDPLDEHRRRLAAWAVSHALPWLRKSAESECYVMCNCQMDALAILNHLDVAEKESTR